MTVCSAREVEDDDPAFAPGVEAQSVPLVHPPVGQAHEVSVAARAGVLG